MSLTKGTLYFWRKGWKTGKMGYNENRKRSKYCCWIVPMRDWNKSLSNLQTSLKIHVEPYLWGIETQKVLFFSLHLEFCWTVPMRDWNLPPRAMDFNGSPVGPYLWEIETFCHWAFVLLSYNICWTVPMRDWNLFLWSFDTTS